MSTYSSGSSFVTARTHRPRGIPMRCWCGEEIITFTSTTKENPYRRFYRCAIALQRRNEEHLFKWVDEATIDEVRMVEEKHMRLVEDVKDVRNLIASNMELQTKLLQEAEEVITKKMNEKIDAELMMAKAKMEKLGHEMVISTMKTVGVVVVVLGSLAWVYGKGIV